MLIRPIALLLLCGVLWAPAGAEVPGTGGSHAPSAPDGLTFGFIGLHGGMFDTVRAFGPALGIKLVYLTDQDTGRVGQECLSLDVVFLQHLRAEQKERYTEILAGARARNPKFVALTCSPPAAELLPDLVKRGIVVSDPEIHRYYSSTKENLRRMLAYAAVKYGGRPGTVEPPLEEPPILVYHPDCPAGFPDIQWFQEWAARRPEASGRTNRVLIVAHSLHLVFQQTQVVDALVRECERQGFLAVCITDGTPGWEAREAEFKPQVIVHTCHGGEEQKNREALDVPHIASLYTKASATESYLQSVQGLAPGELQHQVTSQELKGTIQPLFVGATIQGGGSDEAIQPVPERVEHLVSRVKAMIRLRQEPAARKKVAIVYYDRSMGKSELMRGTATGMFLNSPKSLLRVLRRLGQEGYTMVHPPETEEDLLARMKDHGRQIGVWAPDVLDALAASGKAVLIPAEKYRRWFDTKIPEAQRQQVIQQWGPPPGNFLVWEKDGRKYIVIPRVDLGNVILIPQPLRGEAQTVTALASQTHDKLTPPPHNYLATYFWLQEGFEADALIHFGTHGSEFLLPGKPDGLVQGDWCDIIFGHMPNISVWIVNNVGESTPVRRRSYATIVDHLTPPLVEAELSDELKNLHSDIQKWETVEEGALKDKFLQSINRQIRELRLDRELHMDLVGDRLATPGEIGAVSTYLETIANEMTPTSLHVLGEIPSRELLTPYLVRCVGRKFLTELGKLPRPVIASSATLSELELRKKAEEALNLVLSKKLTPIEALQSEGFAAAKTLPNVIQEGFDLMVQMDADFQKTGQEIDNLMRALNGRFVPPGPANSPDRNPGAIPTGRNMFVVNPEEIPTPQSWEIGKQLIDDLLAEQHRKNGRYPNKVAFSLSSFSSYRDYGVIESQIFYLMGVRPVWNAKRLVNEVEIIPARELGRPRIDVFLSTRSYYRDQLPTRMTLIDKAVKMVAALDEPENYVRQNTLRVTGELEKGGMAPARAEMLAKARMFGWPPGENGSSWYYYLAEKTGEWTGRADLMRVYLEHCKYVYTEDAWGENAPEAFDRTIQGSEMVIRSWADSVRSPLSDKYTWFIDGSLALAIKQLTGKEPAFYLADVRDSGSTRMVRSEDALQADFRVRLFNRKWIEGMMKEGYAGADQVAVHVSNMLGWTVMRENSVTAENWQEVVDVYLRDSKNLHVREWFDKENPHAFQGLTQTLLETARKGYWQADEATIREIATAHAKSVIRYGKNGGLRGGGNVAFQEFIQTALNVLGDPKAQALLAEYKAARPAANAAPASQPGAAVAAPQAGRDEAGKPQSKPAVTPPNVASPVTVSGRKLEAVAPAAPASRPLLLWWVAGAAFIALLGYGFMRRKGSDL